MIARIAGTVILSAIVFVVVSLLVSLGVLWWSGDASRGVRIGVISGALAVFAVGAVSWVGRSGERSGDEHERSGGGWDR